MKRFTSKSQKTGKYGEKICKKYLKMNGYNIVEENYYNSYGEIDIIARRNKALYVYEVKSIIINPRSLSRDTYNPFENITKKKVAKIKKCFFLYLKSNIVSYETIKFYACAVYIDYFNNKHHVEFLSLIDS